MKTSKKSARRISRIVKNLLTAIIYIRVSTDEQLKGTSLDFQLAEITKYAQLKGITILKVFEERGESAKFADRPQLNELLEFCHRNHNRIGSLIIWKVDRLCRNISDFFHIKEELATLDIKIFSVTEPEIGSDGVSGIILEAVTALAAELENTARSERTRNGIQAKIAEGLRPGAPPLGYVPLGSKKRGEKKLLPDPPHETIFPILQTALLEYADANGKMSQEQLRLRLDELGLSTVRGQKTYLQLVGRILHAWLPFYAGIVIDPWTKKEYCGKHKAMLSKEQYNRIVAVRDGHCHSNLGKPIQKQNPMFPLRGTVRCACCNQFLTGAASRGNGGLYPYYRCGNKACPAYSKGIAKASLEQEFGKLSAGFVISEESLAKLGPIAKVEMENDEQNAAGRRAFLTKQLEEMQARRNRIFEGWENGSYSPDEFASRKRGIDAECTRLQLALESLDEAPDIDEVIGFITRFAAECGSNWRTMPEDLKPWFQRLLFPDGICYDRSTGFGTARIGLIFSELRRLQAPESPPVPRTSASWNQCIEEIRKFAAAFEESAIAA